MSFTILSLYAPGESSEYTLDKKMGRPSTGQEELKEENIYLGSHSILTHTHTHIYIYIKQHARTGVDLSGSGYDSVAIAGGH
jgi:hypothetical protein